MVLCLRRRPYTKRVSSGKAKTFRLIHFRLPPQNDYIYEFYVSCDPCIVTTLFIIKPTRCTNFPNLLRHKILHVSVLPLSIIRSSFTVLSALVYVVQVCRQLSSRIRMELVFSLHILLHHIAALVLYSFLWCFYTDILYDMTSSILVLLESCLKPCMTFPIAVCTVNKLLMMDRGTVRNT
jgi:hypothetical protein